MYKKRHISWHVSTMFSFSPNEYYSVPISWKSIHKYSGVYFYPSKPYKHVTQEKQKNRVSKILFSLIHAFILMLSFNMIKTTRCHTLYLSCYLLLVGKYWCSFTHRQEKRLSVKVWRVFLCVWAVNTICG